jgi:hypothetical protein
MMLARRGQVWRMAPRLVNGHLRTEKQETPPFFGTAVWTGLGVTVEGQQG